MEQGGEQLMSPEMMAFLGEMEQAAVDAATTGGLPDERAALYNDYAERIVAFAGRTQESAMRTMEVLMSALSQHVCVGEEMVSAVRDSVSQKLEAAQKQAGQDDATAEKNPEKPHDEKDCKDCQAGKRCKKNKPAIGWLLAA